MAVLERVRTIGVERIELEDEVVPSGRLSE
jgi:hypothetical protein